MKITTPLQKANTREQPSLKIHLPAKVKQELSMIQNPLITKHDMTIYCESFSFKAKLCNDGYGLQFTVPAVIVKKFGWQLKTEVGIELIDNTTFKITDKEDNYFVCVVK